MLLATAVGAETPSCDTITELKCVGALQRPGLIDMLLAARRFLIDWAQSIRVARGHVVMWGGEYKNAPASNRLSQRQ